MNQAELWMIWTGWGADGFRYASSRNAWIVELYQGGTSLSTLSNYCGVTEKRIRQILDKAGVT